MNSIYEIKVIIDGKVNVYSRVPENELFSVLNEISMNDMTLLCITNMKYLRKEVVM